MYVYIYIYLYLDMGCTWYILLRMSNQSSKALFDHCMWFMAKHNVKHYWTLYIYYIYICCTSNHSLCFAFFAGTLTLIAIVCVFFSEMTWPPFSKPPKGCRFTSLYFHAVFFRPTNRLTNSTWKWMGWKTIVSFWDGATWQARTCMLVSGSVSL